MSIGGKTNLDEGKAELTMADKVAIRILLKNKVPDWKIIKILNIEPVELQKFNFYEGCRNTKM